MTTDVKAKPRTSSPRFRRTPTQRDLAVGAGAGGGVRIGADPAIGPSLFHGKQERPDNTASAACSYPEFARSGRPIDGGKRQQRLAPAGQIVHLLRQLQSVSRACTLSDLLGQAKPALAVFRWPARTLLPLF